MTFKKNMIIFWGFILINFNLFLNVLNSSEYSIPPLPEQKMEISDELKYIYFTDQKDREFVLDSSKKYNSLLNINDSIRLSRIIELDTNGFLKTQTQKYYAAWIYNHYGGAFMKNDSLYYTRCISLCNDIINSKSDEYIADTLALTTLNNNNLFQKFKNIVYEFHKIDTLVSQNNDTLIIINSKVSKRAESLKKLAESEFESLFNKEKTSFTLKISNCDNPDSLNLLRESVRAKIIENLEKKSPNLYKMLSKEQLDALVEEGMKQILNIQNSVIEDLQIEQENFKENEK